MTKWEYITAPVLVHATKQILDNLGEDGWELVQVVPGHEPREPRGLLQAPAGGLSHGHPEERLAELGLTVPDVAKPVAAYVPAVRTGNYIYTSGQLPMRDGELMTTGKVGGEVTPEEAVECAQQCALNALAAVKAEIGDLAAVKRIVKVVVLRRLDARLHRAAAGGQRRLASCSARCSATPGCTRGPPSAYRCCRSTLPSRSRSSSRSDRPDAAVRSHPSSSSRPRRTPTGRATPVEPRDAATVVLLRPSATPGPRSTCCAGRRRWRSPAGMCVFPGGGVDPRDFDHSVAWAGPTPAEWAAPARRRRADWRGRWCAPPCARRSRSRGCCWPAPPTTVVADTTGDDWEADRVALEAPGAGVHRVPGPARAGAAHRPARASGPGWLTPVFEPRRYRTWFFVALLPEGQVTRDVSTESSSVTWMPAMSAVRRGRGRRDRSCCRRRTSPASRSGSTPTRPRCSRRPPGGRSRCSRRRWCRRTTSSCCRCRDRYVELVAAR